MRVNYTWGKEPTFIKTREELKKDDAKEEYKNLIVQGWRITEENWTKKELGLLILYWWSNNTQ